jgi:hypothetical protein
MDNVNDVLTFCLHTLAPMSFTTDGNGTQRWLDADGKLHRDGDLPAVVCANGRQQWWKHGKRHRDGDLPAVMWPSGARFWYQHGQQHRDGDLPAVVHTSGTQKWWKQWWVDGVQQTPEDRAQTRRWSALRAAFVAAVVMPT